MAHLVPCPGCARHVRASEPRCPFCSTELAMTTAPPLLPTQRLGRAARFAFGAAVATSLNVAGCYQSHTADETEAGSRDAGSRDAGSRDAGSPRDASVRRDAGLDAGFAPPYGAPADEDAGDIPIYGGPPAD